MVVDDDALILRTTEARLAHAGYVVETFADAESCLERLEEAPAAVVLLDLGLDGMSGREALDILQRRHPQLVVVVVSGRGDPSVIAATIERGAYDYVVKPLNAERVLTTVRNAVERHRMAVRLAQLESSETVETSAIVGLSPEVRSLRRAIERVADSNVSVFVHGESGSGKELVAREVHAHSERRRSPFVAINCAAIPRGLEESELFGHERGAFTSADKRHIGKVQLAHGGTLFLDEVAELSPELQSKLLRVLQERSLQRVGGNEEIPVDFRLIAASHRSLKDEVTEGRFREDLFFRIVVFELLVPALRDRRGDVAVLVEHFIDQLGPDLIGSTPRVAPETMAVLEHYPWPGNVRELQNVLQHSIVTCNGALILPSDLPSWITGALPKPVSTAPPPRRRSPAVAQDYLAGLTLAGIEKRAIVAAIARADGNMSEAARSLGIARSTLYRKVKEHGIRIET